MNSTASRLPSVIVPVLSSSSTSQSPGGLDRAAGEGEHVAAHQPVHAGDPDRREQRPDRGRDQRDQQRDQGRLGEFGAGEEGEGAQRDDDEDEDQGERGEQDAERDLVRGLAPFRPLDQGDHPVEEGLARLLGDLDHDPVREHPGAAGDRAAVAAGLADHRRRLAGDRRLVDRGDALDHGAVAGDRLAGLDHDDVAAERARRPASRRRRAGAPRSRSASRAGSPPGRGRGPRPAPRRGWRRRP